MKKTILLGVIISMGLAFASALYAGENYTINLLGHLDSIESYEITGNLSTINSNLNNFFLELEIPTDYIPSNFSILINGYRDNSPVIIYSGGGGIETIIVYKNITKEIFVEKEIKIIKEINITNTEKEDELKKKLNKQININFILSFCLLLLFFLSLWRWKNLNIKKALR